MLGVIIAVLMVYCVIGFFAVLQAGCENYRIRASTVFLFWLVLLIVSAWRGLREFLQKRWQ